MFLTEAFFEIQIAITPLNWYLRYQQMFFRFQLLVNFFEISKPLEFTNLKKKYGVTSLKMTLSSDMRCLFFCYAKISIFRGSYPQRAAYSLLQYITFLK